MILISCTYDTACIAKGSDLSCVIDAMESSVSAIHDWFCTNQLKLKSNETKYQYMVFTNSTGIHDSAAPLLVSGDMQNSRVDAFKLLGVFFDEG